MKYTLGLDTLDDVIEKLILGYNISQGTQPTTKDSSEDLK
jgi:hypothetical protein